MLGLHVKGFSLIELMIGSTIGLIILGGAVQLYAISIKASHKQLKIARLSHDVLAIQTLIRRELMRSGYWSHIPETQDSRTNPFTEQPAYLTIDAKSKEPANSCILYSYDRYADGLLGVGKGGKKTFATSKDNVEQFGFRLSGKRLQMRLSGTTYHCNSGRWQSLNEESVKINQLIFTKKSQCSHATEANTSCEPGQPVWIHSQVTITLDASLKDDPNIQQLQTSTVNLRNPEWDASW